MKNDVSNKIVNDDGESNMYYSMFSDANVKIKTRIPLIDNLLYKGNVRLNGNTFYFNPEPIRKHTRNPVIFKGRQTTFRVTEDGRITGTMRLMVADFDKPAKVRRFLNEVAQFTDLMLKQRKSDE